MKIHLLGTGTSQGVPVIGCGCPACISDNPKDKRLRVAVLIQTSSSNIVIDVGPDFRQQMLRTKIQDINAILITHQHTDHIIGLDDVRPFNFRSGKNMPIYATPSVQKDLKNRFSYAFSDNPYPGAPQLTLHEIIKDKPITINDISITPIEVWHGQLPVMGFRIDGFSYITDVKTIREEEMNKLRGTEILVISALHHEEHHSHLNLTQALEVIEEIKPRAAYLTHISHRMGPVNDIEASLPDYVKFGFDGQVIYL